MRPISVWFCGLHICRNCMLDSSSIGSCETQDQGFNESGTESSTNIYRFRCSNCIRLMDHEGIIFERRAFMKKWSLTYPLRFCCKSCLEWGCFRMLVKKKKPCSQCKCYSYVVSCPDRYRSIPVTVYDEVFIQEIQPTLGELFSPFTKQEERSRSPRDRNSLPPQLAFND